jgi:hypothetical protein
MEFDLLTRSNASKRRKLFRLDCCTCKERELHSVVTGATMASALIPMFHTPERISWKSHEDVILTDFDPKLSNLY